MYGCNIYNATVANEIFWVQTINFEFEVYAIITNMINFALYSQFQIQF